MSSPDTSDIGRQRERLGTATTGAQVSSAVSRLGHPALGPLVDELAHRYMSGRPVVRVSVPTLDDDGRRRLADLLGIDRYLPAGRQVAMARLAAALGVDVDGLREVVAQLLGPLANRREAREAAADARRQLWDHALDAAVTLDVFPRLDQAERWVRRLAEVGVPGGDVDRHRRLVDAAISCLDRLPAPVAGTGAAKGADTFPGGDAPLTLAGLAADVTGSAHALDPGRRLARAVLDGLAIAHGVEAPADAEAVRALWERAGVVPDPLSSTTLAVGLRPPGHGYLATYLRRAADEAEPVVLTLRQLQAGELGHRPTGGRAFLVENPSLLAHVAGEWDGPPLLCSSGRPTMAVVLLARQLIGAGAAVHQHADFDPAGVAITAWLAERAGTRPWHMDVDRYREAVASHPTIALDGMVGPTPWSPELAPTMAATGRALHEEVMRAELLERMRAPDGRAMPTTPR